METSKVTDDAKPYSTWWDRSKREDACKALVAWSDECIKANAPRAALAYTYCRAYEPERFRMSNISAHSAIFADMANAPNGDDFPIYINKIRELVNSWVNKAVANDVPVPQFVTVSGAPVLPHDPATQLVVAPALRAR